VTDQSNEVRSVKRAFEIIEALKAHGEATVTELADDVGIPASTAHNHLATLESVGYVVKNDHVYDLANRFVHLGDHIKLQQELYRVAKPSIDRFAEQSGEMVNLVVEEHGRAIYLSTSIGDHAPRNFQFVREWDYLHSTAAGKVILASLPEERVHEILDRRGLPTVTERTTTDREELFEELQAVREQGYALNDQENRDGVRAVAAHIRTGSGSPAAVSVSGLTTRIHGDRFAEELPEAVRDVTKAIEIDLIH